MVAFPSSLHEQNDDPNPAGRSSTCQRMASRVIKNFHMVRPESLILKRVKKSQLEKSKSNKSQIEKSKKSQKKDQKKSKKSSNINKKKHKCPVKRLRSKRKPGIYIYMENTGKEDNNIELN